MRHRATATCVATLLTAAALGGCGAADDGAVHLTYWAWAPGMEEVVELWNEANPDVQVTVKKQASGDELVTKTVTAAQAGTAPDLVQAEYQALPTLASNNVTADISAEVAGVEDAFTPAVWQQVTLGTDAVYALPQDSGPLLFFYRADLFEEFGLSVPETWDEFADTARALREIDPDRRLTTFSANDAGLFAGLAQQAGAQWWTTETDRWRVAIDDAAGRRVSAFWEELVAEELVDNQPMYTPAWNQALNEGRQIAWISGVWAPGTLATAAPDTEGTWEAAPLPQWEPGANVTGSWGGSTTAVTTDSEHRAEAAEFAVWLNTDPEALTALVQTCGIYPAATAAQTGEALAEPPPFLANQPAFYETVAEVAEGAAPAAWGPNVTVAYSAFNNAFGAAAGRRAGFEEALAEMQQTTFDDMDRLGFEVVQ
ncbi:extracellular solute-binding protein [Streptomyces sp. 3MP-14]|uniref:Extracellular solute-binding protein n=1 Tax=Streptomyces mimosae TaxID=2586635 RepID=A0A5N6AKW9_9ACTN|nr:MULTISPECIES: extracellular solute-binding protein [Streptomyces]KAB8168865.1 extracellular solute-binding protein [Streptomyces mimosae]KAB8177855.1 extracellular solute-binding protein [Streptomyces sp. 3MP-14]